MGVAPADEHATALFLLLLLSVAAVPGSVFPQRNIDAGRVADYIARTRRPGRGSTASASSTSTRHRGSQRSTCCSSSRSSAASCRAPGSHRGAARHAAARTRRLSRLDEHVEVVTDLAPARRLTLRERRCGASGSVSTRTMPRASGESGYLRETGNLVFHLALTGIIVGMAVGHLFGWRGDIILAEGDEFASSAGTYNTFSPGPWVGEEALPRLRARPRRARRAVQRDARVAPSARRGSSRPTSGWRTSWGRAATKADIAVNHPLAVGGADIFLLGNGYTPVITVRDAKGEVLYREATPFLAAGRELPLGGRRQGALGRARSSSASPASSSRLPSRPSPTARSSVFPDAKDPELALSIWEGNLFPGAPRSRSTPSTPRR